MDGLLGKLKGLLGDEAAKWKRSATLLSGIPKTFKNNPRNLETVDAAFGLGGIVPGVGDYLSALEAKYRWDQGDKLGAGLAGLGALPLIPAIGGMFIGKGAKTWDVLKNAEAVKMEQAGVDPRTIWKETGNWKAPDGQWRQEIPDNTARLKGLSYQGRQGMDEGHGELSGILEHANLYSAYPDTAKIQSSITQGPRIQESGSYSIDGPQYHEFFPQLQASGTDAKSPILHELQHAIQQREGWARGGSPEQMLNEHRSIFANTNLENVSPVKGMNLGDYVTDRYRRLAGEAEARATQARMNMDMPTRLNTFPPESYDVPLDQLIVRYGDGPSMMADDLANAPRRPVNALGQEIPPTQYELAHAEAQRVAALPVEQGGLGLPPNNTAMDRAKAMGYGRELYHATPYEFSEFKPHYYRGASFMADTPKGAWDGMLAGGGDMQFAKHDTDNLGVMLPVRVSGKVYGESIAPDWWFNDVKTYGDMRDVFSGKVPLTNPPVEGLSVSQLEELNKMRMQTAKSSPGAFKEAIPESEWGKYPLITNEYGAIDTPRDFPIIKGDIQTGAENFAPFDYKGFEGYGYDPWAHRPNLKREEVRDLLKKIGFDSAKVSDESGHATAVMNPTRIRSRFAAFNPAKRDSADLLASYLLPATFGGLLGANYLLSPDEGL